MTPVVDVLIVSFLSAAGTRAAAAAVAGPGVEVRIWDNSGEMLGEPGVSGDGSNLFFARPNNLMFQAGSAPYVLLLNPDVVLTHASLMELVAALESHPEAWAAAPRLLWPDGRDQNYLRRLPSALDLVLDLVGPLRPVLRRRWRRYRCLDVDLRRDQLIDQPPAACLLLSRAALGGMLFDEAFPLFFNDVDLCRRMGGKVLYLAGTTAVHEGGASVAQGRRSGVPVVSMYEEGVVRYAASYTGGARWLRLLVAVRRPVRRALGR